MKLNFASLFLLLFPFCCLFSTLFNQIFSYDHGDGAMLARNCAKSPLNFSTDVDMKLVLHESQADNWHKTVKKLCVDFVLRYHGSSDLDVEL